MQRSTDRILTTHAGSLPRPPELLDMLLSGRRDPEFERLARRAAEDVVQRQADAGVDILNDGEVAKTSFSTYVTERLSGFEETSNPRQPHVETTIFPEFYSAPAGPAQFLASIRVLACVDKVAWRGDEQVKRDIANLKAALEGVPAEDAFMSASSPGLVWYYQPNAYYPSHEDYIWAVAEAMKHEYDAINQAGFVVQLDCPDLAGGWNRPEFADKTIEEFRAFARLHVAALNHATRDIPPDRLRMHVCWGNFEGPHVRDIELRSILDILLEARPAGLSLEGSNPRHEHEWQVFSEVKLPEGKVLIPGVLDSTTNFVEHPELIAQRIMRYAGVAGRENVIAGSDCGFATLARSDVVHPTVTWAKLRSLAEGARLASARLWVKRGAPPALRLDNFSGSGSRDGFWRTNEADTVMQKGNLAGWRALAEVAGQRLPGATVVDFGCNMGGFLRYLSDEHSLARGFGLDPAEGAIRQARAANADRPIEYAAAATPPDDWPEADACFSQEVMYLIEDLAGHADDVWRVLRPGGDYLAVTSVHSHSEQARRWHADNAEALKLPVIRGIAQYMAPFQERGFTAEVGWLPVRLVPVDADRVDRAWEILQNWTKGSDKVLFRFTKPDEASPR
jgi:5-methyltetrahydropteroyltriglutamate--homocysteine methyltransferase